MDGLLFFLHLLLQVGQLLVNLFQTFLINTLTVFLHLLLFCALFCDDCLKRLHLCLQVAYPNGVLVHEWLHRRLAASGRFYPLVLTTLHRPYPLLQTRIFFYLCVELLLQTRNVLSALSVSGHRVLCERLFRAQSLYLANEFIIPVLKL